MRFWRQGCRAAIVAALLLAMSGSVLAAPGHAGNHGKGTDELGDKWVRVESSGKHDRNKDDDKKHAHQKRGIKKQLEQKKHFWWKDDGKNQPNKPVTRLEAVMLILRSLELDDDEKELLKKNESLRKLLKPTDKRAHFQPNKPATRAWIDELLTAVYGKDHEMELPGKPGQPNKPVTRAEMRSWLSQLKKEKDNRPEWVWERELRGVIADIDVRNDETRLRIQPESENDEPAPRAVTLLVGEKAKVTYRDEPLDVDLLMEGDEVIVQVERLRRNADEETDGRRIREIDVVSRTQTNIKGSLMELTEKDGVLTVGVRPDDARRANEIERYPVHESAEVWLNLRKIRLQSLVEELAGRVEAGDRAEMVIGGNVVIRLWIDTLGRK